MKLLLPLLLIYASCSTTPSSRCPVNREHPAFIQKAQKNFCKIVQPRLVSCVNGDKKITSKAGNVNLMVSYKVFENGKIKSIHVNESDRIGKKLRECIAKQAAKQKFEANPDGMEYSLDFLFNFNINR